MLPWRCGFAPIESVYRPLELGTSDKADGMSSDRDLQGASYCSNVIPRQIVWAEEISAPPFAILGHVPPMSCPQSNRYRRDRALSRSELEFGRLNAAYSAYSCPTTRLSPVYIYARFPVGLHIVGSWIFPAVSGPRRGCVKYE